MPMLKRLDVAEVLAAESRRHRGGHLLRRGLLAACIALVVVAAGWGWWTWQSQSTPTYLTEPVTRGNLVASLVATGTIAPIQKVAVSSLVTGTISSVDVDYNQAVKQGDPLAHLDPQDLQAKRLRAIAMIDAEAAARDAAGTAVTDAEADLERAQKLSEGTVVSAKAVGLATTAVARARANLSAAKAQLRAAQADFAGATSDLKKTVIVSPIDGVVLDVNAKVGQTVSAALLMTPLFTLASDLRNLELDVDIDEADVDQVNAGDPASFTVESAPDHNVLGKITQIRSEPTVTDGVTSYTAVISVDNSSGSLKPGMTATAIVQTDHANDVMIVSNSALRFTPKNAAPISNGQQRVFVLRAGKLVAVPLTAGLTDGQRTAIVAEELSVGDLVVTGVKDH
jgi:HlyD family secretion protein